MGAARPRHRHTARYRDQWIHRPPADEDGVRCLSHVFHPRHRREPHRTARSGPSSRPIGVAVARDRPTRARPANHPSHDADRCTRVDRGGRDPHVARPTVRTQRPALGPRGVGYPPDRWMARSRLGPIARGRNLPRTPRLPASDGLRHDPRRRCDGDGVRRDVVDRNARRRTPDGPRRRRNDHRARDPRRSTVPACTGARDRRGREPRTGRDLRYRVAVSAHQRRELLPVDRHRCVDPRCFPTSSRRRRVRRRHATGGLGRDTVVDLARRPTPYDFRTSCTGPHEGPGEDATGRRHAGGLPVPARVGDLPGFRRAGHALHVRTRVRDWSDRARDPRHRQDGRGLERRERRHPPHDRSSEAHDDHHALHGRVRGRGRDPGRAPPRRCRSCLGDRDRGDHAERSAACVGQALRPCLVADAVLTACASTVLRAQEASPLRWILRLCSRTSAGRAMSHFPRSDADPG